MIVAACGRRYGDVGSQPAFRPSGVQPGGGPSVDDQCSPGERSIGSVLSWSGAWRGSATSGGCSFAGNTCAVS